MDTRVDHPLPAKPLTTGGINRLSARRVALGSSTTSLKFAEIVLRSVRTLRPLVSVPPIDGNLAIRSVTLPNRSTRSAISVDIGGQRVGCGAGSVDHVDEFLRLGFHLLDKRRRLGQCCLYLVGPRIETRQGVVRLLDQVAERRSLVAGGLAQTVDEIGEVAYRAAVDDDRRRAEQRLDRRRGRGRLEFDGVTVFNNGALGWAGLGGFKATKTSPSGVAERSSAVAALG